MMFSNEFKTLLALIIFISLAFGGLLVEMHR